MRATDGRPYELTFVPTKAAAFHVIWSCSDMVQKLCLHPCLPLEGKVSAKPTDEVFSEAHLYCTYTYIAASRPETPAKPAQRATDGRPYE